MEKFKKYIDKRFLSYPKSRQLDELKEELVVTLTERYQEYLSNGIGEESAFQLAIKSMGDCKDAVNLIESGIDKKTKTMRRWMAIWASALYWVLSATIFLTISFASKKWGKTWVVFPIAAEIYLFTALVLTFINGRSLGKGLKTRISLMLLFLIITLPVYLLISLITKAWAITWVIFLVGLTTAVFLDAAIIRKKHKNLFEVYIHLVILLLTTVVYHLISHFGLISWKYSWLIYLFAIIGVLIYSFIKMFKKYKNETSFK